MHHLNNKIYLKNKSHNESANGIYKRYPFDFMKVFVYYGKSYKIIKLQKPQEFHTLFLYECEN